MPLTALGLVIVAALLHAGWNLWMKHAAVGGGMVFVRTTTVMARWRWRRSPRWSGHFSRGVRSKRAVRGAWQLRPVRQVSVLIALGVALLATAG